MWKYSAGIPFGLKSSILIGLLSCAGQKSVVACLEGTHEEDGECVPDITDSGDLEDVPEDCSGGGDEDGDGLSDCADPDCSESPLCDHDGDGFTGAAGDCDDQDPDVSPEGLDGLIADRDCDGFPATGDLSLAEYTFVGESPDDYAGYWVSSAGDVDGDGLDDIVVGAYDDDDNGQSAGAAYLILGKSLNEKGSFSIADADYKFVGEDAGDWAGFVVDGADVDGDGLDDILIGAYGVDDRGPITGAAYLVLGSSIGQEPTIDLAQADYKFLGESGDDYAGYALSFAGDVDGDGLEDILIGASGQDSGGYQSGAGYLIYASSLGTNATIELSDSDHKFIGETEQDWAGYQITNAGDVDGDGLGDILIGADGDDGGSEAHASYLILGSSLDSNRTIDLSMSDYKFIGEESYDYASQVSTAGDVDGDGLDDILIGAAGCDDGGTSSGGAYIVLAGSLGIEREIDLYYADYKFVGENAEDYAGSTVANAGDVDGDGLGDFLIGALKYHTDFDYQGAAYLLLGSSLGMEKDIDLSTSDYIFVGREKDYAGEALSSAGDIDGDGLDDVLIGAYGGPPWAGAVFVLTGG